MREEGPDLKTNEVSLTMSSEALIKLLRDHHPEALTFLYFLGMLPAGASADQLLMMWGSTHERQTEILSSYGLLENGVARKVLTPFIINYAEETIDAESRE